MGWAVVLIDEGVINEPEAERGTDLGDRIVVCCIKFEMLDKVGLAETFNLCASHTSPAKLTTGTVGEGCGTQGPD